MSDWFPQVVRIEKVEKHPNADRLVIVTVMGDYPVITNMVDIKVGDLIGFLPIDTIVPDTEEFNFLSPKSYEKYEEDGEIKQKQIGPKYAVGSVPEKYRILKAKKILGIYSQGMLHPINPCWQPDKIWSEGDSLVEVMNLKKWEEQEEEFFNKVTGPKTTNRNACKPPSGWSIPYYDIDSVRKYLACLQDNEQIVLTEKLHGCVTKDSMVETLEFGLVSIDFLTGYTKKVHVKSMNVNTGEITFEKCDMVIDNGPSDNWYEIELENGTIIKITGNHLVWLPRLGCYREVANLEEGEDILFD